LQNGCSLAKEAFSQKIIFSTILAKMLSKMPPKMEAAKCSQKYQSIFAIFQGFFGFSWLSSDRLWSADSLLLKAPDGVPLINE